MNDEGNEFTNFFFCQKTEKCITLPNAFCILNVKEYFFSNLKDFFLGSYDDGASEANLHQTFEMQRKELLKCEET